MLGSGRRIQRRRTKSKNSSVAVKRKEKESSSSSSDDDNDNDSLLDNLHNEGETVKKDGNKEMDENQEKEELNGGENDNDENGQEEEEDEASFDSNNFEFSSGNETTHDDNNDDDDDDFSAGKLNDDDNDESVESAVDDEDDSVDNRRRRRNSPRRAASQRNRKVPTKKSNRSSRPIRASSTRGGSAKQGKKPAARRGRANTKNEESSEEEYHSGDHDDDSESDAPSEDSGIQRSKKKKTIPKRKKSLQQKKPRGRPKKGDSSEEEEYQSKNNDESDSESKGNTRRRSRGNAKTPLASRKRKAKAAPARPSAAKKKRGSKSMLEFSSEESSAADEHDSLDKKRTSTSKTGAISTPSPTGSRSKRASAQKAMASLSKFHDDEDDDLIPKSFRKKREDDEEFLNDDGEFEDENESVEEEDLGEDEESIVDKNNVGIVNDDEIGSAEESDEGNTKIPYQSPRVKLVRQSPGRATYNAKSSLQEIDESSEDGSDSDREPFSMSPSMPHCPSERDAITDEELPAKHVCFYSPDGKSRQCFALETLHKITTSGVCPQIRQDLTGRVVQTFLQPPHFRCAMSDDLLDQIASRFGRDALDIHGDYYKRPKDQHVCAAEKDSEDGLNLSEVSDVFVQRVKDYVRNQMGSSDLYVCPLCFLFARRKYGDAELCVESDAKETDDTLFERYIDVRPKDPLEVLFYFDDDGLLLASSFCFPRVSNLKQHLREDHGVATKNIEGNDLYKSYQVRTTDGLLQRFLKFRFGRHVAQGDMQRYWFSGNNFDFLYLYESVEEAQEFRVIAADMDEDKPEKDDKQEKAISFLEKSKAFYDSFETIAKRLWQLLSHPYCKATGKELKDFFASDEDVASDDGNAHRQLDLKRERNHNEGLLTQEEQERIKRYESQGAGELEEDLEEDLEEELVDSDSEEINEEGGAIIRNLSTSSSEEEDDWEQRIKKKRKVRSPDKTKSHRRRSRTSARAEASEYSPDKQEGVASMKRERKKLVIQESEEDE